MAIPRILKTILHDLVESGDLSSEQLKELLEQEGELSGEGLEASLIENFGLKPFRLLRAKSAACGFPVFDASKFQTYDRTFEKLDKDFCEENAVLPIGVVGNYLTVVITDPFDTSLLNAIQEISHCKVNALLGLHSVVVSQFESVTETPKEMGFGDVIESLEDHYGGNGDDEVELNEEDLEDESSPIVQLANRIIEDSYYAGGSDIHVEPFEDYARVRLRVDGVCQEKLKLPPKVAATLMARLKVMANLDIAEKRLPQDGRIVYKQFNRKGIDVDLRVSTAPLNHGEGAVMRILDKSKSTLPLPALGFSESNLSLYRDLIVRPYGMVLHCGPTGSGKSMTLYSALNEINDPGKCIRTAEDPIEYTLDGLLQMQMHRQIGLTFASALRAFLRQDPDIILVGEIRDQETAHIAIEAALTGHMLFSTLHTNDAPSTISRLTEMDVEPFMISASIVCICAQRLMRRVCKTCKQAVEAEGREAEILERAIHWTGQIYQANPKGCPSCGGIGYKGRVGIHELLPTSEELIQGINGGFETAKLKRIGVRNQMVTLHQDSMLKVKDGLTTIKEAISGVPADMEDIDRIIAAKTLEEALAL